MSDKFVIPKGLVDAVVPWMVDNDHLRDTRRTYAKAAIKAALAWRDPETGEPWLVTADQGVVGRAAPRVYAVGHRRTDVEEGGPVTEKVQ